MSLDYLNIPNPSAGRVTPLVDGLKYYKDFFERLDGLSTGDRVYIMNWYMDPTFYRRDAINESYSEDRSLFRILQNLEEQGVDVRVMVWMNTNYFRPVYDVVSTIADLTNADALERLFIAELLPEALTANRPQELVNSFNFHEQQFSTAQMVRDWRASAVADANGGSSLADSIMINTLDAPTGGCHAKFALVLEQTVGGYEGVGYTGGLDFGAGRYGEPLHVDANDGWHDVQAKVEGPEVVSDLVDFYVQMWNENIRRRDAELAASDRRSSVFVGRKLIGNAQPFTLDCVPDDAMTIDRASIVTSSAATTWPHRVQSLRTIPDIYPILGEPELSFAPEGAFEFRDQLRHAIERARTYIYIEDQGMQSLEVYAWLRDALIAQADLQVILLTGARDPADPPTRDIERTLLAWRFFDRLDDDQRSRFRFLACSTYIVHSKVYVIDDAVAIVGSAGMFTRSLTQEIEHAVAFVAEGADTAVADFRNELWSELFGVDPNEMRSEFPTLDRGLDAFDPAKVTDSDAVALPFNARKISQSVDIGNEAYLAVADDGALEEISLTPAEIADVFNGLGLDPADVTVLSGTAILVRQFDWRTYRSVMLTVFGSLRKGQEPAKHQIGPDRTIVPPPSSPPFTATSNSITDVRILAPNTPAERVTAASHGCATDLVAASAMVECIAGPNAGEYRRILAQVGATITFEAFSTPPDVNFDYELIYPNIYEIDLARYSSADAYANERWTMVFDIAKHLLFYEIPYSSLWNPSQAIERLASASMPMPTTGRVAVNEVVTLVVIVSPTETITWECTEPDAGTAGGTGDTFALSFAAPGVKAVRARHMLSDGPPIVYDYRIEVMENSGPDWFTRFEPSRSLDDLEDPFRSRVTAFLSALLNAGADYRVLSTRRPRQRAYLMAWSYRIAEKDFDPTTIESRLDDVPISWVHYSADGTPDLAASKVAAEQMIALYQIGDTGASEKSRHIDGTAIDVKVTLAAPTNIAMANGTALLVNSEQRLTRVGQSYGIRRLKHSNHWSMSGH